MPYTEGHGSKLEKLARSNLPNQNSNLVCLCIAAEHVDQITDQCDGYCAQPLFLYGKSRKVLYSVEASTGEATGND